MVRVVLSVDSRERVQRLLLERGIVVTPAHLPPIAR